MKGSLPLRNGRKARVKGLSKGLKFYLYRVFGFSTEDAAKLAKITKKFGYKLNHKLKKDGLARQRFMEVFNLEALPDAYREVCRLNLMQIAEIEAGALQEYRRKPRLAIDKPQLLKHLKQGAGILVGDDIKETQPTINHAAIQAIIWDITVGKEVIFEKDSSKKGMMRAIRTGRVINPERAKRWGKTREKNQNKSQPSNETQKK
jgi:hypothetical protein